MTVTLELPPDVEAQVIAEANKQAMPLEDYLLALILDPKGLSLEGFEDYLLRKATLLRNGLSPREDKAWQRP